MATTDELDPRGRSVDIGPIVLRTPGFSGHATLIDPVDAAGRGSQLGTAELAAAFADADVEERYTVELDEVRHREDDGSGGRAQVGEDALEVDVPAPASDEGQVLMLVEEDGAITWHLPETAEPTSDSRARAMVRYRLPARTVEVPRDDDAASDRGLLSAVGSKILKILTYPLAPVLKAAGTAFSKAWESKHRPARFRAFTPQNYRTADGVPDLTGDDWRRLSEGPALLFVHGTFSTSHEAFRGLPTAVLAELSERYEGRVFALDHHSIWLPPDANATLVAEAIPADLPFEVDIVSHSRGGLLARELAERPGRAGIPETFRVRNVVMLGTPNAGTALAERANIRTWLDLITNIAQFAPDNPVTDTIALVLTLLKQVALGAFEGLPGVTSMDPAGPYLQELNVDLTPTSTYYAIAADYEPPEGSPFSRLAQDLAADALFSGAQNDLVVPTAGVGTIPALPRFAPTTVTFPAADGVYHGIFFDNPRVTEKLTQWLPG